MAKNFSSVSRVFRDIFIVLLCSIFMWYAHEIFPWLYRIVGANYTPDSESTVRVRRFWASVFLGSMLFLGMAKIIWMYFYRKSAIKSAKGQWYDDPNLGKEDLYDAEQRKDD